MAGYTGEGQARNIVVQRTHRRFPSFLDLIAISRQLRNAFSTAALSARAWGGATTIRLGCPPKIGPVEMGVSG